MSTGFDIALPDYWDWSPIKFATTFLNRGTAPDYVDDGPIRAVSQAANQVGGLDWDRTRFHNHLGNPRELRGYLHSDDVLINSTGTGTLGRVGYFTTGPDNRPCMADGHLTVARADRRIAEPKFMYYWLTSTPFQDYIYSALIVGATNQIELNRERLAGALIALPPVDEQRRIVDFLDAESARIDRLHALRTRQILLFDESVEKRAYDAIRGSMVPGPRKDSGLTWLGSVPESWRVAAVSHHFEVELGKMLNQERAQGDHLGPYLRVANVQWGEIDTTELAYMNFPPGEQRRYGLRDGDLLVCEGGSWPGRAAIWKGGEREMHYQKALHRIRATGEDSARWLYHCLVVAEKMRVFAVQGNSSTMTHLTREQLRPQRFPFPVPEFQRAMVDRLDRAAEVDREAKSAIQRQQALLVERRQALITAAVTGQIDVTTARGVSMSGGVPV